MPEPTQEEKARQEAEAKAQQEAARQQEQEGAQRQTRTRTAPAPEELAEKQNHTVPGGRYEVNGVLVDANRQPLKK